MSTRPPRVPLALGLAASLLVLGLRSLGVFGGVEALAFDRLLRIVGPSAPDRRVAICAIDAASLDEIGQWPWSRATVADLIDRLAYQGARVIALDLVFAEPSRADETVDLSAEDAALATAIGDAGNVVLGFFFRNEPLPSGPLLRRRLASDPAKVRAAAIAQVLGEPPGGFAVPRRIEIEPNLDSLAAAAAAQGFFSNERRPSGVLRAYDLVNAHEDRYYPALALAAVALFEGAELRVGSRQGAVPQLWLVGEGGEAGAVAADDSGALHLRYRGRGGTFPTISAADVLRSRTPEGAFRDRIVFLGATETGIGDVQVTPLGPGMPGVEVHATAADNLLRGEALRVGALQDGLSLGALLLLPPVAALLVASRRRYLVSSLGAMGLISLWPLAGLAALVSAGWQLQLAAPVVAGVLALLAALRYQIGFVDRRAREIKRVFGHYVSPAVVEQLLENPAAVRLGGERRRLTVLFSDIRGFTDLSEKLPPEGVARLLNQYFTPMTRVVLAAGGTLDKYMGDALMAFFGAPAVQPDHAARACAAALAMREELVQLNREWRRSGELVGAELGIGVGLSTGDVSVGNMGSEEVFDYTVLGDAVNLGSRIEGLNKMYGTEVLVAEATAEVAGDGFLFREVDRVRVKGKKQPVTLYELVAREPVADDTRNRIETFARALALYRRRDFEAAAALFAALGEDGPSKLYHERCRYSLTEPPPADWDAVTTLTSK